MANIDDGDVHDWHKSGCQQPLHEFLGMTWDDYKGAVNEDERPIDHHVPLYDGYEEERPRGRAEAEKIEFSPQQKKALEALYSDDSVLLSGISGCGKSTLLREWMANDPRAKHAVVMAPTGVAALQVEGSTIHRVFGFNPHTDLNNPVAGHRAKRLLATVDTLVIDEISMVRADMFHAMDQVMQQAKKTYLPFGGARLILVGDFWQLPPVVRREEAAWMGTQYGSKYGWAFLSPAFIKLNPRIIFLDQPFRQRSDADFASLLDRVRKSDPGIAFDLNKVAKGARQAGDDLPWLCARKNAAEKRNIEGLRRLGGAVKSLEPIISGDRSKVPRELLQPLELAPGARIMCTRNGDGYVNGSLGMIEGSQKGTEDKKPTITVKLDAGYVVEVPRADQDVVGFSTGKGGKPQRDTLATVSQFPLALGYAWTIHKSQGQTLKGAVIDLGSGAFAHGQTYVALSRLESLDGLHLAHPLSDADMLVDPAVPNYFNHLPEYKPSEGKL